MSKKSRTQSSPASKLSVFAQLCKLIPAHLTNQVARQHRVDQKARSISPWSHLVALLWAQFSRAASLNDVCDTLANHRGPLGAIRGALPPSKNGFSHANKVRDCQMAETLFWKVLNHLGSLDRSFGLGRGRLGLPRRFKRAIFAIDSTTIQLVAHCMDWAKHRRRKAAAKCHLRLDLASMLPAFVIVDTAKESDNRRARQLCAHLQAGEVAVFDKAYVDYDHLADLDRRGVNWVSRPRSNMAVRVLKNRLAAPEGNVLADEEVVFETPASQRAYPKSFRRITALVEINGVMTKMVFITNHEGWAASSVCDLYKSRWNIEVFFKQLKQNLKLCDFLGHSANAVRWQLWTALLVLVLLRYLAHSQNWPHSFSRLCTVIRGVLWDRMELGGLLGFYGTAGGCYRMLARPDQAYLPGIFPPQAMG